MGFRVKQFDRVVVVEEFMERLAYTGSLPFLSAHGHIGSVPITGLLVLEQRHKHEFVSQLHWSAPDVDRQ